MKTKLGLSVASLGALTYFSAMTPANMNYLIQILIVGYILIYEKDTWLKRTAVKSVIISISFIFLLALIHFIPELFELLNYLLGVFGENLSLPVLDNIIGFIIIAIKIFQKLLLLSFGLFALKGQTITIGFFDNIIDKHFEETVQQ